MFTQSLARGIINKTSEHLCHQLIIIFEYIYISLTHCCQFSLSYCTYCSSLGLVLYHVSHFEMAGIYVGCHTFHSGLVLVDAATVDIKL